MADAKEFATAPTEGESQDAATPSDAPELTVEEKFELCRSIGDECVTDEELRALLQNKPNPICYDGFEPSGRMHIAQGILKAINVNKLTSCGCTFVFWVADWFALLNNKMGGDLKKIRIVGQYMIEVWRACGMDMSRVEFKWSSDEINANANEYWMLVMNIARAFNVSRVKRCAQIMGRNAGDEMPSAQIMYPCMQCADIFFLKVEQADICQLGLDQRKVNMLAREYCNVIKRKFKPIILSHPMIAGLRQGEEKMSKSVPGSAIFMEDDRASVNSKINKAYCPPRQVIGNPCIEYLKHIVFPKNGKLEILRKPQNGGNATYTTLEELCLDYELGLLHPGDLKKALALALNEMIQPVRDHFKNNKQAKKLLGQVKKFNPTR